MPLFKDQDDFNSNSHFDPVPLMDFTSCLNESRWSNRVAKAYQNNCWYIRMILVRVSLKDTRFGGFCTLHGLSQMGVTRRPRGKGLGCSWKGCRRQGGRRQAYKEVFIASPGTSYPAPWHSRSGWQVTPISNQALVAFRNDEQTRLY
jgi:hypothetical protein